jgi:hypothetical protein
MVQQGQTFELRRRGTSGDRLWAYRYLSPATAPALAQRLLICRIAPLSRHSCKPSDGLEPSTPSLPFRCARN